MILEVLASTLLLAAPRPAAASTTAGGAALAGGALAGAPGSAGLDAHQLAEDMAGALEKTEAAADADIVSEVINGGYRIGLVLSAGRPVRARAAAGHFLPPEPEDPDITFVGVVLREERTKRFLPAAEVKAVLEYEGGGEQQLDELAGPYPVYGRNLRIPVGGTKDKSGRDLGLRGISIVVGPPAYNRHAEMLAAYTGEGVARFEVKPKAGAGKKAPGYEVVDPQKVTPVASDWKIGNDLRQAAGEARAWVRDGEYAIGFIVEGPEPIWLWQGAQKPPQHCPVGPADTNHVEVVVVHMPTGLNVTGGTVGLRLWRRVSRDKPPEQHDFLLRPLLADYYHYGLTTQIPVGTWVAQVFVNGPAVPAWGTEPHPPIPEERLTGLFQYSRAAPVAAGPAGEATAFAERVSGAAAQYGSGDRAGGTKTLVDAFFAFEGSALDNDLRANEPGAYKQLETDWIAVRSKMEAGEDPAAVKAAADGVAATLTRLGAARAAAPADASAGSAFLQSFLVLLREGFEAILVLGILVGVMRKTGRTDSVKLVWGGALGGVVASLVLAAIVTVIFREVALGATREAFEGFTLLLAVVVLFFTSYWLVSRVEGRRWAAFMKDQVQAALGSGRRVAIVSLAFLVVFREGAETVLFYAGLFASAHGATGAILGGIGVAAVALVGVFWVSLVAGASLPVRPFFALTGSLLYFLAFKFAGDGFAELQSAGLVAATRVAWLPSSPALAAWLGFRPTVQTALAQGVLVLAVLAGLAWTFLARPRESSSASAGGATA